VTVVNPAPWIQSGVFNARADRLGATSSVITPGAVTTTGLAVSQTSTPSMSLQVSAGCAYIANTFGTYEGYYVLVNDSQITVTVGSSHPSFTRIDLVVGIVYDGAYAGTDNFAEIKVVPGQPTSSPSAPPLPANSVILAAVTVPALASSLTNANISTDTRQLAKISPSMVNVPQVIKTTGSVPTAPYLGQLVIDQSLGTLMMWDGTGWPVIGPATLTPYKSTGFPAKVNDGKIIRESDTNRIFYYDAGNNKYVYLGAGNGQPFNTHGFGSVLSYASNYRNATGSRSRLELFRDGSGRANIVGAFENASTFTGWTANASFVVAIFSGADWQPAYDIVWPGTADVPSLGPMAIRLILRGKASGSPYGGSAGSLLWQPLVARTASMAAGSIKFNVPPMSWAVTP